jgi:hypothetical protein
MMRRKVHAEFIVRSHRREHLDLILNGRSHSSRDQLLVQVVKRCAAGAASSEDADVPDIPVV